MIKKLKRFDRQDVTLLTLDIIKYGLIISFALVISLLIGKLIADIYGSSKFKYEYFYVAIVNFIVGCAIFDIGIRKNRLPKIIGLISVYLLLYVLIVKGLITSKEGGIEGYYVKGYTVVTIRYLLLFIVVAALLGSYYLKAKIRYIIGFIALISLIYFIALRVRAGFLTDITLAPIGTLLLLPALLGTRLKGESKYQFTHKIFLLYVAIAMAALTLRPAWLTGSDYVIEPCALTIATLIFLYTHYGMVKFKKVTAYNYSQILYILFLLVLVIRSFLTIMRSGW